MPGSVISEETDQESIFLIPLSEIEEEDGVITLPPIVPIPTPTVSGAPPLFVRGRTIQSGPFARTSINASIIFGFLRSGDINIMSNYNDYIRRRNLPENRLSPDSPDHQFQVSGNYLQHHVGVLKSTREGLSHTLRFSMTQGNMQVVLLAGPYRRYCYGTNYPIDTVSNIYFDLLRVGCEIQDGRGEVIFSAT